jgi:hypothetical protein
MIPLNIFLWFCGFCICDRALTALRLEGVYYFLHSVHNGLVVYATAPDVYKTLTEFHRVGQISTNWFALELVFALHFYHIALYFKKFRFDDWLHHVLMIGIALPIGGFLPSGTLLGYSLFFTTGLPGGIDYFLLFLTRNGWLRRESEKRVNSWLATWVRSPGCASQAALTVAFVHMQKSFAGDVYPAHYYGLGLLTAALNYWNGQYFMDQVVRDAAITAQLPRTSGRVV